MRAQGDIIAIVTRASRLNQLKRKRGTLGAAKFALLQAKAHAALDSETVSKAGAFEDYEEEDQAVAKAVETLRKSLDFGYPVTLVDRDHVPNYDFERCQLVVTVGQDGLVANVAKYTGKVPIIGVNPDPKRNDGVLARHGLTQAKTLAKRYLNQRLEAQQVTLAEACLNDGQRLLAFNDLFVGRKGHSSSRYALTVGERSEPQSSSGVLISTGAGSTGWLSSLWNMTRGLAHWHGEYLTEAEPLPWSARSLRWVVREPFASRHSSANLIVGDLHEPNEIVIESLMPDGGIVFSDGMEEDYLEFNSGTTARIRVSKQCAFLL